jgi:hypothetical protein
MQVQTVQGQIVYKDHTIVSVVRTATGSSAGFNATAMVSWKMPDRDRRVMQVLTFSTVHATSENAHSTALDQAKAWVDRHV